MTKTTINDKYKKIILSSPHVRNMIADLKGVNLQTATSWVANENPVLTEFDILKLLSDFYEVDFEDLIKTEQINQLVL